MLTENELRAALDLVSAPGSIFMIQAGLESSEKRALGRIQALAGQPNVVGLGLGERLVQGQPQPELALKYYVSRKQPNSALPPHHRIPSALEVPTMAQPVDVDIEEISTPQLEAFTGQVRPLSPGYAVSNLLGFSGTLGCMVRKTGEQKLYYLSNRHVFVWESDHEKVTIIQPGRDEGGTPDQSVGDVTLFSEMVPDAGFINLTDAAIAQIDPSVQGISFIPQIGIPSGTEKPIRGMVIQKAGAASGYTMGKVRDVDFRTVLTYPGIGRVGFRDQVLCSKYSSPGDSGSCILDMDGKIVGLHFAGSLGASFFTPIQFVLDELGIEVVTT